MKFSFWITWVILSVAACGPLQQSTITSNPLDPTVVVLTFEPTSTLKPTSTLPPTDIPAPTTTATPLVVDISPFHGISSLVDLLGDSTGEVQVRALADDSVWIITNQTVMHWDGQAWEVVLDESEELLAAVDDGEQLWVLRQDTSEISTWQDGQWRAYAADSGWTGVGPFEVNWWAIAPWRVYTGAGGRLWLPMERDVRAFDGNEWTVYTLEDMGFPLPEMEDIGIVHYLITVKDSEEVWVGECYYSGPGPMGGGGVRWYDGQTWYGEDAPIGSKCVSALAVDDIGDVWLGASDSVWHYEHGVQSWTEYHLPEELLSDYNFTHPRQLIVDQAGDVWVSMQMCGGASCDVRANLYRIHDGEWSWIIDSEYWGYSFKQLVLDGNGQGWLFWDGMFYQLNDKSLELITSIAARGVDVSPEGNIWVIAGSEDDASLQVSEP